MTLRDYRTYRKIKVLKSKNKYVSCLKQFPDCPDEPNINKCSGCPLYKNE